MKELDQDPFLITNWEQYCIDCLQAGELWRYRKALCDYIYITNRPIYADLKAYAVKRNGDFARDELGKQIRAQKELPYRGPKRPPMV